MNAPYIANESAEMIVLCPSWARKLVARSCGWDLRDQQNSPLQIRVKEVVSHAFQDCPVSDPYLLQYQG